MKNNFFLKVLSCLFVIIVLLTSIPFSTSAADAKMIDYSDVMSDLEKYGIDKTKYQLDRTAEHIRMLYFLEYGYDYYGNTSDYGLYVYIWNPTGVPIDTSEAVYGKNFIQMQTRSDFGQIENGFRKYKLQLCSYSTEEGYEHVFYKFKIVDAKTIYQTLDKSWRQYDISGIELSRLGNTNPTDYGISQLINCTGFMPYHGAGKVAKTTYESQGVDRLTVELELHPATWKTSTSDKGEGYQYEMFSTYFSVPNDIIRDYGDMAKPTKGLVQVDGTFEEYKVGGIMTSHEALYNYVLPYLHKSVPSEGTDKSVPFWFYSAYVQGIDQGPDVSFNQDSVMLMPLNAVRTLPYITNVIKYAGTLSGLTSEETRDWIYRQIKFEKKSEVLPWVDDGCTLGFQHYSVANEDKNGNKIDLAKQMASFASSYKPDRFMAWLTGVSDLIDASQTYSGISPIRVISSDDVNTLVYSNEKIAKDLFVEESYVDGIANEVESAVLKDKTTYMIRFAVRDYYCEDINVGTDDSQAYGFDDGNYYFEKTIFHNFDVLSLTYENKFGDRTVIPVVSSPIDNFGTITPPAGNDKFDPGSGEKDSAGCEVFNYRPIVIIVGFLVACILINMVLSIFGLNIGKVLKWIWGFVTWPFRALRVAFEKEEMRQEEGKKKQKEEKKKSNKEIRKERASFIDSFVVKEWSDEKRSSDPQPNPYKGSLPPKSRKKFFDFGKASEDKVQKEIRKVVNESLKRDRKERKNRK